MDKGNAALDSAAFFLILRNTPQVALNAPVYLYFSLLAMGGEGKAHRFFSKKSINNLRNHLVARIFATSQLRDFLISLQNNE
jgi:hypothetical protein